MIDQVMKSSSYRDPKMEAYCEEVRRLQDKFHGLELNHTARRYNEAADELAKNHVQSSYGSTKRFR
jgi:ribosomal protein S2